MKSDKTFKIDNTIYHAFPTVEQLVKEAGIEPATKQQLILKIFEKEGIEDVSQLFTYFKADLQDLTISKRHSILLAKHLHRIRRRSQLILNTTQLKEIQSHYQYLPTGNTELDRLLTYANGNQGLRTRTIVEFFGEASIGKTQLMLSLAVMSMKKWNRDVLYIDTERSFDIYRFLEIANYHGIDQEVVDNKLSVAVAFSADDIDEIISEVSLRLQSRDYGMIIIDSIIEALKSQYPMDDDFTNLQARQQHLKMILDQLKSLAMMHELVIVYSNQVRASFDSKKIVPQGGNVLAHASDLRFWIKKIDEKSINQKTSPWRSEITNLHELQMEIRSLELVDCGYLPKGSCDMILGRFGVIDPNHYKKILLPISDGKVQTAELSQELFS